MTDATPFPEWFFRRSDPAPDADFYATPRLVTHIDEGAIAAVGARYAALGLDADVRVLDLMSSWISHLHRAPTELVVLGMNEAELAANPMATERVVRDLNADPTLPFPDGDFDGVLCCVSIDYLIQPVAVLTEVARVLRPAAPVVLTFSNRCFPTKAILAWQSTDDEGRCAIAAEFLRRTGAFDEPQVRRETPGPDRHGRPYRGDPLYSVVAHRSGAPGGVAPGQA